MLLGHEIVQLSRTYIVVHGCGQNATDGRARSHGRRRPVNENNLCGRVAQLHRKVAVNESQKRRNERR